MSLPALLTTPCTLVHSTPDDVDEYGNVVNAETETDAVCRIDQIGANENTDDRDVSDTTWRIFLHSDISIDGLVAVISSSRRYELDGDPWPVWARAAVHHYECRARRTD